MRKITAWVAIARRAHRGRGHLRHELRPHARAAVGVRLPGGAGGDRCSSACSSTADSRRPGGCSAPGLRAAIGSGEECTQRSVRVRSRARCSSFGDGLARRARAARRSPRRARPGEVEALARVAPQLTQGVELVLVLHPVGDRLEPEAVREVDDRRDDGDVLRVGVDPITNERSIFSMSSGKRFSDPSDEWPVRTRRSRAAPRAPSAASSWPSRLSGSSTATSRRSRGTAPRAPCASRSARARPGRPAPGSRRWRADRFTVTRSGRPLRTPTRGPEGTTGAAPTRRSA